MADQPDSQPGGSRRRTHRQVGTEPKQDAVPSTSRSQSIQHSSKFTDTDFSQTKKGKIKVPKRSQSKLSNQGEPPQKSHKQDNTKSSSFSKKAVKRSGKHLDEDKHRTASPPSARSAGYLTGSGHSESSEQELVSGKNIKRSLRSKRSTAIQRTSCDSSASASRSATASDSKGKKPDKKAVAVPSVKSSTSSATFISVSSGSTVSQLEAELSKSESNSLLVPKKRLRSHTQVLETTALSKKNTHTGVKEEETASSSHPQEKSQSSKSSRGKKTGASASCSGRNSSLSRRQGGHQTSGSRAGGRERISAAKPQASSLMSAQDGNNADSGARSREEGAPATNSAGPASSGTALSSTTAENDTEETDMGRLQALLEARGLPSHLFGALGPRMHQLLHRTMSGGTMSKVQTLQASLQANDEGQQLSAVMEMCQMLVMGNEDSLAGFPVKQVVPLLIQLLKMDHNFDIMHNACRALTYMMDALPRSSAVVVEAVPVFLEKLQAIQCMDVAEQSLAALETLSHRNGKAILQAGGIKACLMYLDFFSITAQRNALAVTANCVQNMTTEEFHHIRDSISLLSGKLKHEDKKSVESVCLCFSRLVDNFQSDQRLLKEIAVHGLLTNIQQLLVISPPVISTPIFVTVIRMLAVMCACCPDLAVVLLKQKIAETLCYLLVGTSEPVNQNNIELVARTPQELYEIVCLIGELLPKLPSDGIFAIDNTIRKGSSVSSEAVMWQWQDDRGLWHNYSPIDSKIIESAYMNGEEEVSLSTVGRSYTIELNSMQQVNEDTGTARPVQRKINPLVSTVAHTASSSPSPADLSLERCDSRAEILKEDSGLASSFIQTLFAVLYEVYCSSAGPTVRHKCLQTLLRMIFYASPSLLEQVLHNQPVSSHIAAMLASPDLKVVVGAIQMAETLMQKLPDIFSTYFRREGVMHQIKTLAEMSLATPVSSKSSLTCSSSLSVSSTTPVTCTSSASLITSSDGGKQDTEDAANSQGASAQPDDHSTSSAQMRISDVLKRKKPPKRGLNRKGNKTEEVPAESTSRSSSSRSSRGKTNASKETKSGTSSKMSSLLPSFNPRTWMRSSSSTDRPPLPKDTTIQKVTSTTVIASKEKIRSWIKEQAIKFMEKYFSDESHGNSHPALSVLNRLCAASENLSIEEDRGIDALVEIDSIVKDSDVSPFEIIHSGLIHKLLLYLTSTDGAVPRDLRLRRFLHVFLHCPLPETTHIKEMINTIENPPVLSALTAKVIGCLHQLEQFQVKVHDLPGGGSSSGRGSNALKFFSTHQLKCQLQRHPSCTNLRQWKGGPVKIDPLALVQAIERYLVMRGYGRIKDADENGSDDENSDDDVEDTMAAVFISQGSSGHKLEFLIGDHILPYNMTVYQAIQQFSSPPDHDAGETDSDNPLGSTGIWVHTHTIWYRAASDQEDHLATSPKKTKAESRGSKVSKKKSEDFIKEGPMMVPTLIAYLSDKLPSFVTVLDPSLEVIALLRVLHALNRCWATFFEVSFFPMPLLLSSEFVSNKLTAKASRQMQDPLIIMTGNLPNWLSEIGSAAPFLFPFDTRQMLFFATSFDRDRAMMRLQQESLGDSSSNDTERVGPRLDRIRKQVNRVDLMKQAEKVFDELKNMKAMLEIHYFDEEGTGLGPTLEFYALISQELQRADLEMWRGETVKLPSPGDPSTAVEYMYSPCGLFPAPLPRNSKPAVVNKIKTKFKFFGKFLAKALMDSRMIDLPLSLVFYKWMLNQENSLTSADLQFVDPVAARSFLQLEDIVHQRKRILASKHLSEQAKQVALENLTLDGCRVEDMDLTFMLPGTLLELKRGGKDILVTLDNLEEYLQLIIQWSLVDGVSRQFEAFREGFESVFSLSSLHYFYPEELEQLFCGSTSDMWDVKMLMDYCRPDHGYTHDSRAVKFLFEILSSYQTQEQRDFLRFVTGSPRLPVGGFRSLNPLMTIVRKTFDTPENPDNFLPSVMTCVNYLKLPDYSSIEIMKEKLSVAIKEGQLSFHLS